MLHKEYTCILREWSRLWLVSAYSPVMEEFIFFHDFVIIIITFIGAFVLCLIATLFYDNIYDLGMVHGGILERIWTVIPACVLLQVGLPSLILLYALEDIRADLLTVKILGHQWYWSYEYGDFSDTIEEYDSYLIADKLLRNEDIRLLDTDRRIVVPFRISTRLLISRRDVLHSWAIPSLGVKVDATPGRLNQISIVVNRPRVLYGFCREICGAGHSNIPIRLEAVSLEDFLLWVGKITKRDILN